MYLSLNFRCPLMNGASSSSATPVADSAFKTVPSSGAPALPPISTCLKDSTGLLPPGILPPGHHPQHHLPPQYPHPHHHPDTTFHHPGFKDHYPGALQPHHPGVAHPAFPMSVPPWIQQTQAYNLAHLQHLLGADKGVSHCLSDSMTKAALLDLGRIHAQYPLNKKLFGCPQCRYITDRKNNLKRHVATMHQDCDKSLECCGIAFKNKASLRDHVLIFHSNGYLCRFCGRNFCRKALLKRHLTVHSGQKDYLCAHCDYATSHKSNLERHKKVHERQSPDEEDEAEIHGTPAPSYVTRDVTVAPSTTVSSSTSLGENHDSNVISQHHHHHNHHQPKTIHQPLVLDNDLSLGNIDVVGVDIAEQASSFIDVVQLHE